MAAGRTGAGSSQFGMVDVGCLGKTLGVLMRAGNEHPTAMLLGPSNVLLGSSDLHEVGGVMESRMGLG